VLAGIPCRVYEAAAEILPLGVGINVLPHATAELQNLGVLEALERVAVVTREAAFFNRLYPIRNDVDAGGRQLVNGVAELEGAEPVRRDWTAGGRLDDFFPAFRDWHFDWLDVARLIRETPSVLAAGGAGRRPGGPDALRRGPQRRHGEGRADEPDPSARRHPARGARALGRQAFRAHRGCRPARGPGADRRPLQAGRRHAPGRRRSRDRRQTLSPFDAYRRRGFLAPAGTPADVVRKVNADRVKALALPDVRASLNAQGMEVAPSGPEDMAALMRRDAGRWAGVVKQAGIKAE
jgi:hypothetical protein